MSLAIRALSVLVGFAITWYIGHYLGPVANGQYALITQTGMFLSVVAVGGIDMAVVREFSATIAQKVALGRRTFARTTMHALAIAGLIAAAIAIGGQSLLKLLLGENLPASAVILLCLVFFARTMTRIMSATLRSQKSYFLSQIVEVLMIPSIVVAGILAGLLPTIEAILWATAIAGIVAAIVGIAGSLRHTSNAPDALQVDSKALLKIALPLWGVAIALNFAEWYGLATVATMLGTYEAGLYRVAIQIGTVFSIVSMGLFAVFSAKISAAAAGNDRREIARLGRTATLLSTALVVPLALAIFGFATPLLKLIGEEFASAAAILQIVVVGQLVYTMTGPAGLVLALTGHQRVNLRITIMSMIFLVFAAPAAALFAGAVGVACVASGVVIGRNLASLYFVKSLEGINVVTGYCSNDVPVASV